MLYEVITKIDQENIRNTTENNINELQFHGTFFSINLLLI